MIAKLIALAVLLLASTAAMTDAAEIVLRLPDDPQPVRHEILGINLNYLADAEMLEPEDGIPLVEGLRRLGVRNLRFPGGNKSDSHLWSVPPFREPQPRLAVTGEWDWPAMEPTIWDREQGRFARRVLDTDDALAIADELEAELVMVVPYDEAYPDPTEEDGRYDNDLSVDELIATAAAWVRYCREQGHPVRYWEIGNETYFHRGISAERYARDVVRYAEAMRAVDPDIRIGVNGRERPDSQGDADQDTDVRWWPTVLRIAGEHIDYLSIHQYPCYGWRSFAAYAERLPNVRRDIRAMTTFLDEQRAHTGGRRLPLLITECNSADWLSFPENTENWPHTGSIGHALVLMDMLGQYLAEPAVDAVQVWNTRWMHWRELDELWDALADDNTPSAIGQAMTLWSGSGDRWLAHEQVPGLRCFATWHSDEERATVFLINRTEVAQTVALSGAPIADAATVTARTWAGTDADDLHPRFGEATAVDPARLEIPAAGLLIVETGH